MASKNISGCTVSYTALPMKTDLHFQPTLSYLQNFKQSSIQLFFFSKNSSKCIDTFFQDVLQVQSVLTSFGIQATDEELDLPYIYWIPKMHKNPYKHRFVAGSSKCSTKPLSILLTKLLTHIKQGLQKYCETSYSRSGDNQMWILKNSKELLEHLQSPNFNHITNIKSFDCSTL